MRKLGTLWNTFWKNKPWQDTLWKNALKTLPEQCVTVPKMLNDTDTDTFFRYQIFSIPIPVLFPVPNFSDTGSETFFRYQILPIPVPILFSGTNFFRYRFRYHQKKWKIPGTGTGTHYKCSKFKKNFEKNLFRYQIFLIPVPIPNFTDTGSETFFRHQIFPILVPIPPEKMKNSWYQFRYPLEIFWIPKFWQQKSAPVPNFSDTGSETFFRYQIFPIPVPRLFSGTNIFRYRYRYHQKNYKFPVPGIPGTGTSHSAIESIAWEQIEPPHLIVGSGSDVALPVQEARIHNIHCRPVEGCRHNLLQGGDGDRGEGVRDQVRHCPRLLPG